MSKLLRYIPDEAGRNALDVGLKWVFYIPGLLKSQISHSIHSFIHSFICSFNKSLVGSSVPGTVVGAGSSVMNQAP